MPKQPRTATWSPERDRWETSAPSDVYSGTYPPSGTMRGGTWYERPRWAPLTSERASSFSPANGDLLPTPTSNLGSNGGSQDPEKRRAGGHSVSLQDVAEHRLIPTPRAHDTDFGEYARAVERWEVILDRPAPPPTAPTGRGGAYRLSSVFVEWMMGLPEGHVTGEDLDLSRAAQLRILGNGVVPQQAAAALSTMKAEFELDDLL